MILRIEMRDLEITIVDARVNALKALNIIRGRECSYTEHRNIIQKGESRGSDRFVTYKRFHFTNSVAAGEHVLNYYAPFNCNNPLAAR